MKNPFTSPEAFGVAVRYVTTNLLSLIALLGTMAALSPEQVMELTKAVNDFMAQLPGLFSTISGLGSIALTAYAVLTKAFSAKAAEAAKEIDKNVPPAAPVEIVTPDGQPNIIVPGK